MNRGESEKKAPATVFKGAELYELLRKHEAEKSPLPASMSSAEDRMNSLAVRIGGIETESCDPDTLYQIAIWALFENAGRFIDRFAGAELLAGAASRGHEGARFVLAKGVAENIWWAKDEVRYLASDGSAESLAWDWLTALAAAGYEDARLELACLAWALGKEKQARSLFEALSDTLPESKIKKGVFLLASSDMRGADLIDDGEGIVSSAGSVLIRLEEAMKKTQVAL